MADRQVADDLCMPKTPCPKCGFESEAIRCPRCNALKLTACTGVCSGCARACAAKPKAEDPGRRG